MEKKNLNLISFLLIIIGIPIVITSIFFYTMASAWATIYGDPLLRACMKENANLTLALGLIGGFIPIILGIIGAIYPRRKWKEKKENKQE